MKIDKILRIKELVQILNQAGYEYYQNNNEIISNLEYDMLYDELLQLEAETGMILSSSPTQKVGYELLSELPKTMHEFPMLSLDKTKSIARLEEWLEDREGILSWKLDGLTIVLTYRGGKLVQAVTRGNGTVGELITENAKSFANLPVYIGYQGELVLRGEAVIRYSDFKKINEKIEDIESRYKNPRNLCSGSVRQLNPAITKQRNVQFFAFSLVYAEGIEFQNSRKEQLLWLSKQGFDIVEYISCKKENINQTVEYFSNKIIDFDIPSDGLVLLLEDIAYGESLGSTSKFPRNAIAFKWKDEIKETKFRYMEWSPSRTGLINPVAIFDSIDLEGTTVTRASVHNISIVEALELGEGDIITVYKANMIIPQIADNLTRSASLKIPKYCPACKMETSIKNENEIKTLYCTNVHCPIKAIKSFTLMVSRDALNIDGLSEMTLEKFLSKGLIREWADIFTLEKYQEEITNLEGFGKRSYEKLIQAIEKAKNTNMTRLVYALGITGIGLSNAKMISKYFYNDFSRFYTATKEELLEIEGIGEILADSIITFFQDKYNQKRIEHLLQVLNLEKGNQVVKENQILLGMTFVITGKLMSFGSRKELETWIENLGGKISSSVSTKTNFLINNDIGSHSGKNKKAKELGIEILSENMLLERFGE